MKDLHPLVSVLMTAYNREKYIAEAIESVMAQTYDNWELIITDDCSKDKTLDIARHYERLDSRIHVYENEVNLGDYPNRNKAASYAKGKYLKYLDSDDMMYPWALQNMVLMMEAYPQAMIGYCCRETDRIYPKLLSPVDAYRWHYFGMDIFARSPLSVIINRCAFENVGGFTGKQHLGDFEMWNILSRKYPSVIMPFGMCWYRIHPDQQQNDNRTDLSVPYKYLVLTLELINNPECPLPERERDVVIAYTKHSMCTSLIRAYLSGDFAAAKRMQEMTTCSLLSIVKYLPRQPRSLPK